MFVLPVTKQCGENMLKAHTRVSHHSFVRFGLDYCYWREPGMWCDCVLGTLKSPQAQEALAERTTAALELAWDGPDIRSKPILEDKSETRVCACLRPKLVAKEISYLLQVTTFYHRAWKYACPPISICLGPARNQLSRMHSWADKHIVLDTYRVKDQSRRVGFPRDFLALLGRTFKHGALGVIPRWTKSDKPGRGCPKANRAVGGREMVWGS